MTNSENRLFFGSASGCIEEMSRSQTVLLILFHEFNEAWNFNIPFVLCEIDEADDIVVYLFQDWRSTDGSTGELFQDR